MIRPLQTSPHYPHVSTTGLIQFTEEIRTTPDGGKQSKRTTIYSWETEELIAGGAIIVAVIMALGMMVGWVPINELTVGILAFTGIGSAISNMRRAHNNRQE